MVQRRSYKKFVVVEGFNDVIEVGCSLEREVSDKDCEKIAWNREKCGVWTLEMRLFYEDYSSDIITIG